MPWLSVAEAARGVHAGDDLGAAIGVDIGDDRHGVAGAHAEGLLLDRAVDPPNIAGPPRRSRPPRACRRRRGRTPRPRSSGVCTAAIGAVHSEHAVGARTTPNAVEPARPMSPAVVIEVGDRHRPPVPPSTVSRHRPLDRAACSSTQIGPDPATTTSGLASASKLPIASARPSARGVLVHMDVPSAVGLAAGTTSGCRPCRGPRSRPAGLGVRAAAGRAGPPGRAVGVEDDGPARSRAAVAVEVGDRRPLLIWAWFEVSAT